MQSRAKRMEQQLRAEFTPDTLHIQDDSARHAGHAGASPQGESHYRIEMVSAAFVGMSRLQRQRAVNDCLKEEFQQGLHALQLQLKAPGE